MLNFRPQDLGYYNGYIYRVIWAESGRNGNFPVDSNVLLQFAADGSSYEAFYLKNPACEMESVAFDNGKPYFLYNACNGKARQSGRFAIVTTNDTTTMSKMYHRYTVKYNANGGSWSGSAPSANDNNYVGLASTLTKSKPTRNGYTFLGWAKKKDAKKASYSVGDKVVLRKYGASDSNLTLYAVWATSEKVVYFNENGGAGGEETITTADPVIILPDNEDVAREGYIFKGWSEKEEPGNDDKVYEAEAEYVLPGAEETVLYAVWELDSRPIEEVSCAPDDLDCICSLDAESAECKGSGLKSLPKTGPGEIAIMIVAITSVITGGLYWFRSQKELQDIQKKY